MDGNVALSDELLKECIEKYTDMIFRVSYQYVSNRQDAEDIVQEVFLGLVERLKQCPFNDSEHLKAWLIRVTVNKSINAAKYNARRRAKNIDNCPSQGGGDISELNEQLEKLAPGDRQIIYLHYYEGYAAKDIAHFLGMKENAVHKRLSRARGKLKKFLTEED